MGDYRADLRAFVTRAAGETSGTAGSYLYPTEFLPELAIQLAEYGALFGDFTRVQADHGRPVNYATRVTATAGTLQAGDGTQASGVDAVYAGSTLNAYTITGGVQQVSLQLELDSADLPIEDIIHDFAVESIGRGLSTYSVSGTGTSQPAGVIPYLNTTGTAGTAGGAIAATGGFVTLSAARALEVNGAATTELAAKFPAPITLLSMVQAVDPAYHNGAKWYMTVNQFATACQVTDTAGQPIIRPNGPMTMYGFPVCLANELPAMAASTTGGPVFGNLGKLMYWRDAGLQIARTTELHGDYLQASYIGYGRHDFKGRDGRAAVTVKCAAT